jgi:hypothetical protein
LVTNIRHKTPKVIAAKVKTPKVNQVNGILIVDS